MKVLCLHMEMGLRCKSKKTLSFHLRNKKMITVTAVRPPARFGEITIENNKVTSFIEKPQLQMDGLMEVFIANKGFLS